jgi:hypothetical protein
MIPSPRVVSDGFYCELTTKILILGSIGRTPAPDKPQNRHKQRKHLQTRAKQTKTTSK